MKFEQPIRHEDRKPNTMTSTKQSRLWITLLALNSAYWVFFWWYFFWQSSVALPITTWEQEVPFYVVFGRAFGGADPVAFHTWLIQSALWLNLPCWLITWPLGHAMGSVQIASTNYAGLRLILVTLLSYGQWYGIGRIAGIVRERWKNGPGRVAQA